MYATISYGEHGLALQDDLPHDIRLIAAVSRLIDFHQSQRTSGAYVPEIHDRAGFNLHLALLVINTLHDIELDRGDGYCPMVELTQRVIERFPDSAPQDIRLAVENLGQGREIHYGQTSCEGETIYARTWETTPLIEMQGNGSQVRLSENARLFLRVSSLRGSWLYSDIDADRIIKAFERGQFQDISTFSRSMTLDPVINESFDAWAMRHQPGYHLGNLQAELDLILQSVEALSRQFLRFLRLAQQVKNDGVQPIHFLGIANNLVLHGSENDIAKAEAVMSSILPAGVSLQSDTQLFFLYQAKPFFRVSIFSHPNRHI